MIFDNYFETCNWEIGLKIAHYFGEKNAMPILYVFVWTHQFTENIALSWIFEDSKIYSQPVLATQKSKWIDIHKHCRI